MAIFRQSLTASGVNLGALGVAIQSCDGWSDGVLQTLTLSGIPRRAGVLVSRREENGGRPFQVSATLMADTVALRNSKMDQIKALLESGPIQLERVSYPARRAIGYLSGKIKVTEVGALRPAFKFEFPVLGISSYLADTLPLPYSFGATRTAMPLGTAQVAPIIIIRGSAVNPVLKYRNLAGDVLNTCTFTTTLASTDLIWIDTGTYSITDIGGASVYSIYSGDNLPILDPADGNYENGGWPSLEVTTGTAYAMYGRAWR